MLIGGVKGGKFDNNSNYSMNFSPFCGFVVSVSFRGFSPLFLRGEKKNKSMKEM